MADVLIGTSGYYYDEWVGTVYPEGTKSQDYLKCYSELFPTVEINFSYYRMPNAKGIIGILTNGGNLTYSIKAHKTLTHEIPSDWESEATKYLTAIDPLISSNKLEAVLFQFPYKFHYTEDNRRYLGKLLTYFKGVPMAVEFRGADWCNNNVIDELKKREISFVCVDMPDKKNLPPVMEVTTAPLAYIRFHGRNKDAWWGKDAHKQYDYLYSDEELETWAVRIKRIAEQARRILVYMNNHPFGKAAKNAQTLEKMLKELKHETTDGMPS